MGEHYTMIREGDAAYPSRTHRLRCWEDGKVGIYRRTRKARICVQDTFLATYTKHAVCVLTPGLRIIVPNEWAGRRVRVTVQPVEEPFFYDTESEQVSVRPVMEP